MPSDQLTNEAIAVLAKRASSAVINQALSHLLDERDSDSTPSYVARTIAALLAQPDIHLPQFNIERIFDAYYCSPSDTQPELATAISQLAKKYCFELVGQLLKIKKLDNTSRQLVIALWPNLEAKDQTKILKDLLSRELNHFTVVNNDRSRPLAALETINELTLSPEQIQFLRPHMYKAYNSNNGKVHPHLTEIMQKFESQQSPSRVNGTLFNNSNTQPKSGPHLPATPNNP